MIEDILGPKVIIFDIFNISMATRDSCFCSETWQLSYSECLLPIADAFLHQIHTSTENLSSRVTLVNDIMASRITTNLSNIQSMFLFDYDLAFGQIWVSVSDIHIAYI